jgi:hypothetical protein
MQLAPNPQELIDFALSHVHPSKYLRGSIISTNFITYSTLSLLCPITLQLVYLTTCFTWFYFFHTHLTLSPSTSLYIPWNIKIFITSLVFPIPPSIYGSLSLLRSPPPLLSLYLTPLPYYFPSILLLYYRSGSAP